MQHTTITSTPAPDYRFRHTDSYGFSPNWIFKAYIDYPRLPTSGKQAPGHMVNCKSIARRGHARIDSFWESFVCK